MPITKIRALLQFRLGSHALPIEAGFQGLRYHAIYAAAHFAAPGLLVSAISLNAQDLSPVCSIV